MPIADSHRWLRALFAIVLALSNVAALARTSENAHAKHDTSELYIGYPELAPESCGQPLAFMTMLTKGIARTPKHDVKGRRKGMAKRPRSDDAAVVLVNMCEDAGWETNTYTGILSDEAGLRGAGDGIPLHAFCVT
jgi:hypothetical protein